MGFKNTVELLACSIEKVLIFCVAVKRNFSHKEGKVITDSEVYQLSVKI